MNQSGRFPSAAGRSNPGTTPVLAHKNSLNFSRFGTEVQWLRHSCLLALTQKACAPAFHAEPGCALSATAIARQLPADRSAVVANSNRRTPISNRHLVRLESTATPTKSTTSLFLIDTKQRNCFASIALPAHPPCRERSAHRRGGHSGPPSSAAGKSLPSPRAERPPWREARPFLAPFAHAFDLASTPLPFGPAPAASISNRHLVQLEIAVSDRKQSSEHISNRPKLVALNSVSISQNRSRRPAAPDSLNAREVEPEVAVVVVFGEDDFAGGAGEGGGELVGEAARFEDARGDAEVASGGVGGREANGRRDFL